MNGPNVFLVTSRSVRLDWWRCSSVPVINALYNADSYTRSPQMKVPLSLALLWIRKDIHIQIQTPIPRGCSCLPGVATPPPCLRLYLASSSVCLPNGCSVTLCNWSDLLSPCSCSDDDWLSHWLSLRLFLSPCSSAVTLQLFSLSTVSLIVILSLYHALTVSVLVCTLYLLLLLVTCCTLILNKAYRTVGLSVYWSPSIYLPLSKHLSINPSICLSVYHPLTIHPLPVSIHPFIHLSVGLSAFRSPSFRPSVHPTYYPTLLYSLLTVSDAYSMYPSVCDYRLIYVHPLIVFMNITKAMAKPCWMRKLNIYNFISLGSVGPTFTWH